MAERAFQFIRLGELPENPNPPMGLGRFARYFLGQVKGFLLLLLVLEACMAVAQVMIPVMLGWLVNDFRNLGSADAVLAQPWLLHVGVPVMAAWGLLSVGLWYLYDHFYTPNFGNMIRFQLGRYTLGQSMAYFQNDFAGRIATKVLEGGPAMREPTRSAIGAVWYAGVFVLTGIWLMLGSDARLALPAVLWLAGYVAVLYFFLPEVKRLRLAHSRHHTRLVGHVNDTYSNILSVKLFGRERYEMGEQLTLLQRHRDTMRASNHAVWRMTTLHTLLNVLLMTGTTATALVLWRAGTITPGEIVMALPMVWQMVNQSGWIRSEVTRIFEDMSRVEECMETIAKPYTVTDAPDAVPLAVKPEGGGRVVFDGVSFHYGKDAANGGGVITDLNLTIPAGQKVGLVGPSGAGKSTLVSLLLRFYDVAEGRILIDGQDIATVTQESLRQKIGVVTQDSSLLHRSIADNIRYGRPDATDEDVVAAAKRAHAHEFILRLEDKYGRKGYDAQVGERGVKLSGGQRQRISIARVILENAPILILDEATSALDSEIEAAIQEEMAALMVGKTTLAIAHRLSTIIQMDRLVVIDGGRIVEDGTHEELLLKRGLYAALWRRQSGGFLGDV